MKRTGTLEGPFTDAEGKRYYRARVRLTDGSRSRRFRVPPEHCTPAGGLSAKERAAAWVAWFQEQEDERHLIFAQKTAPAANDTSHGSPTAPETVDEWFARYLVICGELGLGVRDLRSAWTRISQRLGTTPIASVERSQVVALRDELAGATRAKGGISPARAMNVWSTLTAAFSRAFSDDDPDFHKVIVGPAMANPCMAIKPPVDAERRKKGKRERQHLQPREFVRFLASEQVPMHWKVLCAIAVYTYLRPQELFALEWGDVDLEAEQILVCRRLDMRTGQIREGTKTGDDRHVPIHPRLLGLLQAMRQGHKATERVIPLPRRVRMAKKSALGVRFVEKSLAVETVRYLRAAGIERRTLFEGSSRLQAFDFRSWRTTGCTWLAMTGVDSYVIARQSGHRTPKTTWAHYAKEGPEACRREGVPFPALPAALLGPLRWPTDFSRDGQVVELFGVQRVRRAGLEPAA